MKPPLADVAAPKKASPEVPSGQALTNEPSEKKEKEPPQPETRAAEAGVVANRGPEEKKLNFALTVNLETKVENKAANAAEEKPVEVKIPTGSPAEKAETGAEAKPVEIKPSAGKSPEKVTARAKLDRMFDYAFDAITSDARGKVASVEKEKGRYFSEELPGGIALEMVEVTGGSFLMGSSDSEISQNEKPYSRDLGKQLREKVLERLPAETPQHVVKVPSFYMGKFEVTQAQWRAIVSLPKVKLDMMSDPSQFSGGNRPVERISWEEAVEFCERLSRATGRKYRLPTEAEWEYACRAGTESPFHFGPAITTEWANFDGKRPFLSSPEGENRQQTVIAGSLGGANAFGLYDMHGNVWEWCLDGWHESYRSAPGDGAAWQKGGAPYLKVLRGGSWDSAAVECRSGFRDRLTPTLRMNTVGFRLVTEVTTQAEAR